MEETIILSWWQILLMIAGGVAILYVLFFVALGVAGFIYDKIDEWTGKKKEREDELHEFALNHFRGLIMEMSQKYDDRHGIRYCDEGSALNWFYQKYSTEELRAMDGESYNIMELYTEEELAKIAS